MSVSTADNRPLVNGSRTRFQHESIGPACERNGFHNLPEHGVRPNTGQWHVLHVRPRQEKAMAEVLVAMQVPCFLPLVPRMRYYQHRKRRVELPLFPSYVFMYGTREDSFRAIETKRVVRVLTVAAQGALEHELAQLDLALRGEAPLDPYPDLGVGTPVVVTRGPLRGLEGVIDERCGNDRLILNVTMIGRGTSLEIDASLLEALGPTPA